MKKYMVADLMKELDPEYINYLVKTYPLTEEEVKIMDEFGIKYPLDNTDPDNKLQFWIKVKDYPEAFEFDVQASKGRGPGNLHKEPMRVSAEPILESIGNLGDETPMYDVYCEWHGPTEAQTKAYEMNLEEIDAWESNPTGTYFNENVRLAGAYTPYPG